MLDGCLCKSDTDRSAWDQITKTPKMVPILFANDVPFLKSGCAADGEPSRAGCSDRANQIVCSIGKDLKHTASPSESALDRTMDRPKCTLKSLRLSLLPCVNGLWTFSTLRTAPGPPHWLANARTAKAVAIRGSSSFTRFSGFAQLPS